MTDQDDVPRLAEISRTITDFRLEFREALTGMVRRDVYTAEMRTFEVRIASLVTEIARIERENAVEVKRVDDEIEKDRQERRSLRNLMLGTGLTALVSLALMLFQTVVK